MNPEHITWLLLPSAVLLGILHGLEPGHSKTMMASFIIATRGTNAQAVLLGVSAAASHSLVIWALAAMALRFGREWNAETAEPYLQIFSAVAIVALAIWMFRRTKAEVDAAHHHHHGHHRCPRRLEHPPCMRPGMRGIISSTLLALIDLRPLSDDSQPGQSRTRTYIILCYKSSFRQKQ